MTNNKNSVAKRPLEPSHRQFNSEDLISLIMPAGTVPNGTEVTKLTGEKRYTVRRNFRVGDQTLVSSPGAVFLVPDDGGDVYSCGDTTSLRLRLTVEDTHELLDEILQNRYDK